MEDRAVVKDAQEDAGEAFALEAPANTDATLEGVQGVQISRVRESALVAEALAL